MSLQNEGLREVQAILLPSMGIPLPPDPETGENRAPETDEQDQAKSQDHSEQETAGDAATSGRPPSTSTLNNTAEFIPQLFYSLHQIRKDPNNSAKQLETSTAFIKHRLKSCKALIASNEDCKRLLSKTPEEWHEYMQNREEELQLKRQLLQDLRNKLETLQSNR